jgi:Glycogen recognition site of AMP-activated protein kinase
MTDPSQTDLRMERGVRELRRMVRHDGLAISRIMGAVRRRPSSGKWRWTLIAAAIATLVFTGSVLLQRMLGPGSQVRSDQASVGAFVQFVYVGPDAREVSLVGSFNDWDPHANPLHRDGKDGVWFAEVAVPPGHHEYAFNVDGRWVPDDDAPLGPSDEFGVANSVILVQ